MYNKQEIISARFGALWSAASAAIETADVMHVIGYSLPEADLHGRNLIKRAIRRNRTSPEIVVVNPDAEISSKVAQVGQMDSVHWYRSLDDLIASLE